MAYYAQRNYPQELGFGTFTIAEAGCLLTAICNLLSKFGNTIDPVALNNFYKQHGFYLKDPDGAAEDLSWGSLSQFAADILTGPTGTTPVPSSDMSIVKFHYDSVQTGRPIDHFCAVDRIENGLLYIIDSYDGLIKGPTAYEPVYHKPVAWCVYSKLAPQPAPAPAPLPPPSPAGAMRVPSGVPYRIVKTIPGYFTSGQAASHGKSNSTVPPGTYEVFNTFNGMVNVTRQPGVPGWWINPDDNVLEEPAPPPPTPPAPVADVTPPAVPAAPNWRASYKSHPETYVALATIMVHDLAGQKPDVTLSQYEEVPGAGTFTGPDGVLYVRTINSVKDFVWYGIPMSNLMLEDEAMPAVRQVTNTLHLRDRLIIFVAKLASFIDRLPNLSKKESIK